MSVDYEAELRKAGTYFYRRSTHLMVRCPFHADNDPSLQLELVRGKYPAGFFKCWGCGVGGDWNRLAHKVGAAIDDDVDSSVVLNKSVVVTGTTKDMVLSQGWGVLPMKPKGWRSISGKLLRDLGAIMVIDHHHIPLVFLPVIVNGDVVGGVAAALTKDAIDGDGNEILKYRTTRGTWVVSHGLFPYDYVTDMAEDYVVLVEGPRDALRLISYGVPALAVLGANLATAKKALLAMGVTPNLKTVILMPDGDQGGERMRDKWLSLLADTELRVIDFTLPDGVDPMDLTDKQLDKVKAKAVVKRQKVI